MWTKTRLAKFRRTMKNKKKEIQSNAFMSKKKTVRPNYKKQLSEAEDRNEQLNESVEYLRKELDAVRKQLDENTLNLIKDIEARDKLLFNMRHADQFDSKLNLNIERAVMATNERLADKTGPDNDLADKLNFQSTTADPTNPTHYKSHPSGIECIQVIRHMNFNRGNAIKYIWRAGLKNDEIHDLAKAVWYLKDEIQRLKKEKLNE